MTRTFVSRRLFLAGAVGVGLSSHPAIAKPRIDLGKRALAELELKSGGRLGVCILDTATGRLLGHRMDERFAMCSTFKMPLAAAILQRADQGKLSLDTFVPYTKADMIFHAPVTGANLSKGGMTIRALAEAAQKQSDNPAANLLLKHIGGPQGLTQFFRDLGDGTTRVDRFEPEMNDVKPGDERDTTTPAAMAATARKILTRDVLIPASRDLLIQWMIDTATGAKRLRAGMPKDWRAGDKTGTGLDGTWGKYNDIAIAWPPGRTPLVVTAFYNVENPTEEIRDKDQAVLAEVGRIATAWVS